MFAVNVRMKPGRSIVLFAGATPAPGPTTFLAMGGTVARAGAAEEYEDVAIAPAGAWMTRRMGMGSDGSSGPGVASVRRTPGPPSVGAEPRLDGHRTRAPDLAELRERARRCTRMLDALGDPTEGAGQRELCVGHQLR